MTNGQNNKFVSCAKINKLISTFDCHRPIPTEAIFFLKSKAIISVLELKQIGIRSASILGSLESRHLIHHRVKLI